MRSFLLVVTKSPPRYRIQSQLEKPEYIQEKNMTGVWEPEVGFGRSVRAEPLEPNKEEIRAKIG